VQRFASELRKLRQEAGGTTYRTMARGTAYSLTTLSRAAAGDQLPSLPVTLAYVAACGGDSEEWERRWRAADAETTAAAVAADDTDPPYQGLARFEPGDSERFFGRERLSGEVLALLRGRRFSAVFGPSGSGKSSLLRAGLIPALQTEPSPQLRPAAIRILTPGPHPARAHTALFTPKDGLGETVVVIDQFEEVFTLCTDLDERKAFIDLALTALQPDSRLRVVLAVRADFYGRCAEHDALAQALGTTSLLVGPMNPAELREAIVKPAMASGLIVEQALTARIVEEVTGEPGGLPLMSHALLETWHHRKGRALGEAAYDAAGGIHGAITRTAEDVYTQLTPAQADIARRILLRLITPGQGAQDTRRPVTRAELDTDQPDDTAVVLERLARARLVTLDDDSVDLAHEALITAWPRLHTWIDESREQLRVHRRLTEDAQAWHQLGRDPGALYRGTRLAAAEEAFAARRQAVDLTEREYAFLAASIALREQERRGAARTARRQRAFVASLSVLAVLALVAGVIAWQENMAGDQQRIDTAARRAATVAEGLRAADPRAALRLSVAAWRLKHTPETRAALLQAVAQQEQDPFKTPEQTDADVHLAENGRTLTGVEDGKVIQWDTSSRRRIHTYRIPKDMQDNVTDVTSDGQVLVVGDAGADLKVRLWDIRAGRFHAPAIGPAGTLPADSQYGARLSNRGDWMLFTVGSRLEAWNTHNGRRLFKASLPKAETPGYGDVSTDGRHVALCTRHGLRVWDTRTGHRNDSGWQTRPGCVPENGLLFTPDGRALALQDEHGLRRVQLSDGRALPRLDQVSPTQFVFTPDGRFVAGMGYADITVWRLDRPEAPVFRYVLTDDSPDDLQIDTKANVLRYTTADASGGEIVRTLGLGRSLDAAWQRHPVEEAVFSQDSSVLVDLRAIGQRGELSVLDGHNGRTRRTMALRKPPVPRSYDSGERTSLSADGQRLAYNLDLDDDQEAPAGVSIWDTRNGRLLTRVTPAGGTSRFPSMLLTADGHDLITQDDVRNIATLWDARSGRKRRTIDYDAQAPKDTVGASLYPVTGDGRTVVTDTGVLLPLQRGLPRSARLTQCTLCALASTRDGSRIAVLQTYTATLWNKGLNAPLGVLSGGLSKDVPGDAEETTSVVFSPDGSTLAVGGSHGTLALWDVASQRPLGNLPTPGDAILSLAFSKDGGTLYTAGEHVAWQEYDIDPDRAVLAVCRRAGGPLSRGEWHTYLPGVSYRRTCRGWDGQGPQHSNDHRHRHMA
jgi:WD40 repeat protein